MKPHYYSEWEPYAAQWLRNLINAGHIPAGEVDERSIVDVSPSDLAGFGQCHFFAGIGGWPLAARLAGWPEDRELWTGSAPCQPFSVAGKGKAQADDRHLWPHYFRLIEARRPAVAMGEQVAAAVGKDWLDGVFADLESIGYACGATVVPACAVDAPHRRDRLWFVADRCGADALAHTSSAERRTLPSGGNVEHGADAGRKETAGRCAVDRAESLADTSSERRQQDASGSHGDESPHEGRAAPLHHLATGHGESRWTGAGWIIGHDGKARRVEPSIRLLAHGVPARVGRLRAYGNAIVPQVAAEVIAAFMDVRP